MATRPDPTSQFLNQIPAFLDSWDAVAAAIALGDIEVAWHLVRANKQMTARLKSSWSAAAEHNDEVRVLLEKMIAPSGVRTNDS